MVVLCLGTNEGGDAYNCDVRKGKFPIWELDRHAPKCQIGTLPLHFKGAVKVANLTTFTCAITGGLSSTDRDREQDCLIP